ncbi:hypothetical protein L1887_49936 [Cichorium endivia]|nr:hypothetical protein L1887_49936 [Cichorium endivia]
MPPSEVASHGARRWKKAARARRNRSFSSLPARIGQVPSGQASPVAEARQEGEAVNEQKAESSSTPATAAISPASQGQIPSSVKAESSSTPAASNKSPAPYDQRGRDRKPVDLEFCAERGRGRRLVDLD